MNINLLTRQQLEIINRRTLKYPLQVAEKDYFLALVMQIVSESVLGQRLIFKGGTAIHHCYLEQTRFSEDLDYSSNRIILSLEQLREVFNDFDFLTIKKEYHSEATIKIDRLQFTGPLTLPNFLKIEVDFLHRVLLPPKLMLYRNVWGLNFTAQVMDEREICAEKIRAMSDRARYRDFYDFYWLSKTFPVDLEEIVGLIREKEMKMPISREAIIRNWRLIGTGILAEMEQIHYSRAVVVDEIEKMIEALPFTQIELPGIP